MEDSESRGEFVVKDKRRFTQEGETRDETLKGIPTVENETSQDAVMEDTQAEKPTPNDSGKQAHEHQPLDFITFFVSLANTALFQLGLIKDPESGETKKDLSGARQTIDLLAMLEEKTRGNLTDSEAKIVKETLFQLRMAFVEAGK